QASGPRRRSGSPSGRRRRTRSSPKRSPACSHARRHEVQSASDSSCAAWVATQVPIRGSALPIVDSAIPTAAVIASRAPVAVLGPMVDRVLRKGLMIVAELGRLAGFAALPFTCAAAATVGLAAAAVIGNTLIRTAVLAGHPYLVANSEQPAANTLLQVVEW